MRLRALSVLLFVSFAAASTAAAQIRAIVDGPEPWGMEFIPTGEPHTFMLAFLANVVLGAALMTLVTRRPLPRGRT